MPQQTRQANTAAAPPTPTSAPTSAPSSAPPPPPAPQAGIRLTGRGAMLGIFVLCFLGLVVADWLHWGMLTGGAFVAASVLAAVRTQRTDLLTVAVSPPALFAAAVICGKALVAPGSLVLSTTEGTLITLANTAPWLIVGTVANLVIAFSRGLWGNVRTLSVDLRGDPVRKPGPRG